MKWVAVLYTLLASLATGLMPAAAATAGTEVNVYSARQEALIRPILDRFTEVSGITVRLVAGEADPLIERLKAEGANSPADVLLTVDVARLVRAAREGLLQPTTSELLAAAVPAAYRHPEGLWWGLSLRSRVVVYAPDRVKPAELPDYEDLAGPAYHGRICVRSSQNTYNQGLVASQIAHQGAAAAEAWVRGLVANLARPPQGGDRDQIKAVAAGECDFALVNTYYLAGMQRSQDAAELAAAGKVALHWPNQQSTGAHMNISGAGVVRTAPHPEAALKLIEFLAGTEAQRWYAEVNHEFPVRADVAADGLFGPFKPDDLPLTEIERFTPDAIRIMDRAAWP